MVGFTRIEYMCTYCGRKTIKSTRAGRPEPGRCPRKTNGGPHHWVQNRKLVWNKIFKSQLKRVKPKL